VIIFYGKGVIHHEFVPNGQTVNGQFYLEVMKQLREAERRKRPEGWRNKSRMLHHDKAPAHTLLLVSKFLVKYEMTVVPQPPYSPDLALQTIFVPEVEINSERSPISDNRRDRRKFATGPTYCPAKTRSRTGKKVGSGV
jgi:hypothetical protein